MRRYLGGFIGVATAVILVSIGLIGTAQATSIDSSRYASTQVRSQDCDPKGNDANDKSSNKCKDSNSKNDQKKITICHATGSASNPFVEIQISENGWNGHQGHGDLTPVPVGGCPVAAASVTIVSSVILTESVITQMRNAGLTVIEITPGVIDINGIRFIILPTNDLVATSSTLSALDTSTPVFRMGANLVALQAADTAIPAATQNVLVATFGPASTSGEIGLALTAAPAPAATGSGGSLISRATSW